jgi:hypothetical protein
MSFRAEALEAADNAIDEKLRDLREHRNSKFPRHHIAAIEYLHAKMKER